MSELNDLEGLEEERELKKITGTPRHIEVNQRTIKAYQEEFAKKGLQVESRDYPQEEFHLVKNQLKFDSIVDASQRIQKKIGAMCRQPITVTEKGKTVTKDGLYYYGYYRGVDKRGTEIGAEFHEGWYLKPKLRFYLQDPSHPYDSVTGERKGKYQASGNTYEHYIFLPDNKADRVKFLNDLMDKSLGTTPESVAYGGHLSFRASSPDNNHSGLTAGDSIGPSSVNCL